MKKVFLIMIAALCLAAVGCTKTCQCTETATVTYEYSEDWPIPINIDPIVSSDDYTAEAKKCSDLNKESTTNSSMMGATVSTKTVIECR
ncbi:MAG: hypothetical protein LBK03_08670 [Bacteroidales bacterium]|jgi:hypothetical protein|nr:hypothetical protein [Bacteroidales bacterium]